MKDMASHSFTYSFIHSFSICECSSVLGNMIGEGDRMMNINRTGACLDEVPYLGEEKDISKRGVNIKLQVATNSIQNI